MTSPVEDGLRMLARRPYTAAEIRTKLREMGHDPEDVRTAMRRLDELGYLDDLQAARATVRRRIRMPRGRRQVARELHRRGCSDEVVEAALADFDEESVALDLVTRERKAGRTRQGLVRHLRSRGFPDPLILRILDESDIPGPFGEAPESPDGSFS